MADNAQPSAAASSRDDLRASRQPSRRRIGRMLLAAALVLLAVLWAVWHFHYDGADPRLILWPREPEPAEPAALDKIVSLHVRERPVREVLAELSRRHGVAIGVDDAAIKDGGLTTNPIVSIDVDGVTLRTALDLLVLQAYDDLLVVFRGDDLSVTTRGHYDATLGNCATRVYPLGRLLAADDKLNESQVAELVQAVVAPGKWNSSGGGGEIETLPGALVVKQTPEVHREVQALLDALAELLRQPGRLVPLEVGIPPAVLPGRKRLLAALDEPSDADFVETPLDEAIARLSKQHGVPIALDRPLNQWARTALYGSPDSSITFCLKGPSLRTTLEVLCDRLDLGYAVHRDAIVVGTREQAMNRKSVRLYPMADLLNGRLRDGKALADRIADYADDDVLSLLRMGVRPGALRCISGTLVVRENERIHHQIERLLADLRHAWRPSFYLPAQSPSDLANRRIEAALDRPATLQLSGTPLAEAARRISRHYGAAVFLDLGALGEAGIKGDTPATLSRSDVPLRFALRLDANGLGGPDSLLRQYGHEVGLQLAAHDGVLWITTLREVDRRMFTRCYNVAPLLNAANRDGFVKFLENRGISFRSQKDGVLQSSNLFDDVLIVARRPEEHHELAALLAAFEQRLDAPDSVEPIDVATSGFAMCQRWRAKLRQPARLHFADTPLAEAMSEIASRYQIPMRLEGGAIFGADSASPVTIDAAGLRLDSALNLMLLEAGAAADLEESGIIVSTEMYRRQQQPHWRLYPVGDLVRNQDERYWLTTFIRQLGRIDDRAGRIVTIEQDGGAMAIRAPFDVHDWLEQLLDAMRRMRQASAGGGVEQLVEQIGAPPGSAERRILETLEQPADVIVDGEPLEEALRRLAAEHGLPLWIDRPSMDRRPAEFRKKVWFALRGATLGRALELLLSEQSLHYYVRDEVLLVASPSVHLSLRHRPLRLYSIADLRRRYPDVNAPQSTSAFDVRLRQELQEGFGKPLAIFGDFVGLSGPQSLHRELRSMLRDLRRACKLDRTAPPDLLDRPVSLQCRDMPLAEAVRKLSRDNGVPVILDQTWNDSLPRPVEQGVSCTLRDVPLRDAVSALLPEVPLVTSDEENLIVVTRAPAMHRVKSRVHLLGELLDRFPELDERFFHELVTATVTPLQWQDEPRIAMAALPRALVVRHNPPGHAATERVLAFVASQEEKYPRPSDLQRDDNRRAQAALADRLRAADDSLEALWLLELAKSVDNPSEELGEALLAQFFRAAELRQLAVLHSVSQTGIQFKERGSAAVPFLEAMFADAADKRERSELIAILTRIAKLGPAVLLAASRQLNHAESFDDNETAMLLDLLRDNKGASAVPALVELLPGYHGTFAGKLLREVDPEGAASREYVEHRLAEAGLSPREREELIVLQKLVGGLFGAPREERPERPGPSLGKSDRKR